MLNITQTNAVKRLPFAEKTEIAGRIIASINMTDEEARKQLPQIAQVVEDYQRNRASGDDPPTALKKTLTLLRELRGGCAYVPHRGA